MSSCSLNTTLNSWVSEQAYLPLSSPVRACVCSVGSKGLLARRRKVLSGSIFHIISAHNGLNKFIRSSASYRLRALFRFQYPLNQFLTPPFPIGKIVNKCPEFVQGCFRKHRKHFFDMVYFANCCIHKNIIAQGMSKTSQKLCQTSPVIFER